MNNSISNHAKTRFQQRGINEKVVDYLKKYGDASYAPGGAKKITLTRRNVDKIISNLKRDIHLLEHAGRVVLIEKDGQILTGYHKS